jgi:hypothetical protein
MYPSHVYEAAVPVMPYWGVNIVLSGGIVTAKMRLELG